MRNQADGGNRRTGGRRALLLALVGGLAAGCSSFSGIFPSKSSTTSTGSVPFGDRISALFGASSPSSTTEASTASADFDCPRIDIRPGASTLVMTADATDPNALTLKYQGSFVRAARECRVQPPNLSIKVGVEGRIILGPAGGPGQFAVPLRYALVQEGVGESKTIWTKLYTVPVTIAPREPSVSFTNIEDDMTVPMPTAAMLENYVIYIGFDPQAAAPEQKKKPAKPAPKPRTPRTG